MRKAIKAIELSLIAIVICLVILVLFTWGIYKNPLIVLTILGIIAFITLVAYIYMNLTEETKR